MSHPYYGLNELREMFLSFFETKDHLRLPSFSLVPQNDNSILLINAGMTPMKPWFKGEEEPPRRRVCTCQKCIRTGDIENVGKTARHGTYFEMLGNFSFGDYFKREAIHWSWEFLTSPDWVGIAPDRLYPQAIAFNAVQRQSIMDDPQWRGGDYEGAGPVNGLAAARMLAMITYKSEQTFSNRYMREMADEAAGAWGGQFRIESYLHHHGQELVKRFDANCYLYLTRMMDLHDIGGVDAAWKRFAGRRLLGLGISSDMLFPNWQVEEAVRAAAKNGVAAYYEEIESDNGHDAFLMDFDQLDDYLREFLQEE